MHRLILASRSPRRQALLEKLGVDFDVVTEEVDESFDEDMAPNEIVESLALEKADPVSRRFPDRLVLAADTIVVLDRQVLVKPESEDHARSMLSSLSGRTHQVYTGIALIHLGSSRQLLAHQVTKVSFGDLTSSEIDDYVAGGSPMDKAGAYGIQDDRGCLFIASIDGDYYNVVGLPLNLLYRLTRHHFSDLSIF